MKKETIEIKAAYVAPEIRVHEVRAQQSFMSYNDENHTEYFGLDEEEYL